MVFGYRMLNMSQIQILRLPFPTVLSVNHLLVVFVFLLVMNVFVKWVLN